MKPKPIQKPQSRPPLQKPPTSQQPMKKHSDFSEEYAGVVKVYMIDNKVIEGKLVEARRYWMKIEANGETFYINKAYIVYIQPVKPVQTPANGNTNPPSAK